MFEPWLAYFWSGPSQCFIMKFLNWGDLCRDILSCTANIRPLPILESIKSQGELIPFMINGHPSLNNQVKHITSVSKPHRQHHPYQKHSSLFRHATCFILFNLQDYSWRKLSITFCKWLNWDPENLRNSFKITHLSLIVLEAQAPVLPSPPQNLFIGMIK